MDRLVYVVFLVAITISAVSAHHYVRSSPAIISNHPYQVAVLVNGNLECSGTIIGHHHILTAANCTFGKHCHTFQVRAGSSFWDEGGELLKVTEITEHPQYDPSTSSDWDFSILKLDYALVYDDNILEISLSGANENVVGASALNVTRWSKRANNEITSQLLKIQVYALNQKTCRQLYSDAQITDQMFCAGGTVPCPGGIGGSVVQDDTLFGVVSGRYGCGLPTLPGAYGRVASVVPWINKVAFGGP